MIPRLDGYTFVTPETLDEALADLAAHAGARPFAGGTDIMVLLEAGQLPPARYVDLRHCHELVGIEHGAEGVTVGALTTYTEIRSAPDLAGDYPMLRMAASETGGVATQNRGTIGGNIANASPAADTPPALLAYDAELELASPGSRRRVPYRDFHTGYKKMDLRPGELIARIHLPPRAEWLPPAAGSSTGGRDYYRKIGTRRAQAISKVCFAGAIRMDGPRVADVRIALASVAPTVIRAYRAEDAVRGTTIDGASIAAALQALDSEISPIDDIRSTARYRRRVAANLLRDFLDQK
jgi:CO/xanthine dehydrogenase FAD-binding subunit